MATADQQAVQPYLFFDGKCEAALNFYREALGAEITFLMRFKDAPPSDQPGMCKPGSENKVMHASFRLAGSTVLASDGRCEDKPKFEGFSLSLTVPNAPAAERFFRALSNGGQVQMPLSKTFFSESFGMVTDQFGVHWMVYVAPQNPGHA